jgi:hypothetical protein
MKDLMIDIETLGTKPGCVILSISAIWFDIETGGIGDQFDMHIDVNDAVEKGLTINLETVQWWMGQDVEARIKVLCNDGCTLSDVLLSFVEFFNKNKGNDVQIWGNSPSFDLAIMKSAFEKVKLPIPWKHYQERDVRTLVMFAPHIKKQTEFKGIPHYGIDDCKHQINYCCTIYKKLRF